MTMPVLVRPAPSSCPPCITLAMPKSSTFSESGWASSTKMFSGFRSRWITPWSWAACNPAQICSRKGMICLADIWPDSNWISLNSRPSSFSIT